MSESKITMKRMPKEELLQFLYDTPSDEFGRNIPVNNEYGFIMIGYTISPTGSKGDYLFTRGFKIIEDKNGNEVYTIFQNGFDMAVMYEITEYEFHALSGHHQLNLTQCDFSFIENRDRKMTAYEDRNNHYVTREGRYYPREIQHPKIY